MAASSFAPGHDTKYFLTQNFNHIGAVPMDQAVRLKAAKHQMNPELNQGVLLYGQTYSIKLGSLT